MGKKTDHKFLKIVLFFILGMMLFVFQSCKKDRSSTYLAASLGISADDYYPSWSPDGSRIVFFSDRDGNYEIYSMNPDGSNQTRLTDNPAGDRQPSFSPNGQQILFVSERDGNVEIYVMNADGSDQKRLTENPASDHCPFWSPNGEWFVAAGGGPIKAIKADDKTQMDLSAPGCTPDISPDGKRLAWNGSDFSLNIGALDFDSPQSNVTDHRMVVACEREYWIYDADWSPDEKNLAFTYGFDDEGKQESEKNPWSHICICDLSTGKWTQITTDGKHNKEPDWVPVQVR